MSSILDSPFIVFAASLLAQWVAAYTGAFLRKHMRPLSEDDHADLNIIETAALTLLALIIGFSFSMAVTRYDQRKNYEQAEANAIGTEYLRAGLLSTDDAAHARELLRKYLDYRISFYLARNEGLVAQIGVDTAKVQAELWTVVLHAAQTQPTPVVALAVGGMNDVLNSQGYTQAAWWNRIPVAAWVLMALMAVSSNFLIGYSERRKGTVFLLVLPVIVSISFFLIADIDSPRGGVIRVLPQNLIALSQSVKLL